jgi:uncharacterized protein YfdQ (DUF2303 family)
MIDTLEVIDHITADCIEGGDVISFHTNQTYGDGDFQETLTVESLADNGATVTVTGVSEVTGDREVYAMLPDEHVALMAEPVEDI